MRLAHRRRTDEPIEMAIPVIDLFAGPGGLGEGFSKAEGADFEIVLSIEKDEMAHETLRMRAAHRALFRDADASEATWRQWDSLVRSEPWNIVFYKLRDSGHPAIHRACSKAEAEALNLELGPGNRQRVSEALRRALYEFRKGSASSNTVLIGGPPCQAYSIVGRSRNRGIEDYRPEADHRHFLYREYLHVIAELRPAVFVMENVKGILTSRVMDRRIFQSILDDLRRPELSPRKRAGPEYVLTSLGGSGGLSEEPAPEDFIVRAEEHGVPQARHRVIILGIRRDVFDRLKHLPKLERTAAPSVVDVIGDLPKLRPQLSFRGAGMHWTDAFEDPLFDAAVQQIGATNDERAVSLARLMQTRRTEFKSMTRDRGHGQDRTLRSNRPSRQPRALRDWYVDRPSELLSNHECRAHMPSDLIRYLFVAAFGEIYKESPRLADFPPCLLPDHRNVAHQTIDQAIFKDRFRVQLADRFSMTVTSHIAKDGHAFIHPDSGQCRSLTVREAARLQTFPDSYVFLGNRTSQYVQVGNAVPPYLALQIAEVVAYIFRSARLL